MYALCWADKKPKFFISNRGTTLPASPSVRVRHRVVSVNGVSCTEKYQVEVPRPHLVELYYSKFSKIDVHNHYRQGSLKLEKEWHTKIWWRRMFASLFGMIITDAFLAYTYDELDSGNTSVMDFNEFRARLAYQLVHNDLRVKKKKRQAENTPNDDFMVSKNKKAPC